MNEIHVERAPAPLKLEVLSVDEWLLKTLEVGKYARTHSAAEQCYLEMGKLELQLQSNNSGTESDDGSGAESHNGSDNNSASEPIQVERGDLFVIPASSQVIWNVIQTAEYRYHYLEENLSAD